MKRLALLCALLAASACYRWTPQQRRQFISRCETDFASAKVIEVVRGVCPDGGRFFRCTAQHNRGTELEIYKCLMLHPEDADHHGEVDTVELTFRRNTLERMRMLSDGTGHETDRRDFRE
jgi:hypothetical protein